MPLLFWLIGRVQFGIRRPRTRVLGSEFAGEVAAVGGNVTRYEIGDRVFGFRRPRMGAYAEYLCVPEQAVMAPMPANVTFEEAATVPSGAMPRSRGSAGPTRRRSLQHPLPGSARPGREPPRRQPVGLSAHPGVIGQHGRRALRPLLMPGQGQTMRQGRFGKGL